MNHNALFERIEDEIPGYLSAAVGSIRGGGTMAFHAAKGLSLSEGEEPLGRVARAFADLYEALGGRVDMGSNDDLLVTASRGYILVKLDHGSGRFIAVLLSSSGNIGFLRFQIRAYLRDLVSMGG